jgi:ArsR family transcriptional regulator
MMKSITGRKRSPEPTPSCQGGEHAGPDRQRSAYTSAAVTRAAELFRAMGDPPRLRVLEMLSRGRCCVSEIVQSVGDKFSTVSQRLRVLRDQRLIVRSREGSHVFYSLADRHVADLIHNALEHATEPSAVRAPGDTEEGV